MIPYGRQTIDEEDIRAVVEVLRSDWLTTGPKVDEFEKGIAAFCGVDHAVAVSSGTAGLHAVMHVIGIQPGDEVIVPAMSFAATANSILFLGGTPVFCDVEPTTLLINARQIESRITNRTKAILAVDYGGQPCDYDALRAITDKHGLVLITDACHSIGAEYKGRRVGTLADLTVFSFHPVKHLTTGEGGLVVTSEENWADRLRWFRNHGITTDSRRRAEVGQWYYEMADLGFNYRLSDIHCALGCSQLKKLPAWIERRRSIATQYQTMLAAIDGLQPLENLEDRIGAFHLFVIMIDASRYGRTRDTLYHDLHKKGIKVQVHYIPIHLHPYYQERLGTQAGMCPVAEERYHCILSLPMYPALTDGDIESVVSELAIP